jgi:hypothetical protein
MWYKNERDEVGLPLKPLLDRRLWKGEIREETSNSPLQTDPEEIQIGTYT